jgi:hypothetical protein
MAGNLILNVLDSDFEFIVEPTTDIVVKGKEARRAKDTDVMTMCGI